MIWKTGMEFAPIVVEPQKKEFGKTVYFNMNQRVQTTKNYYLIAPAVQTQFGIIVLAFILLQAVNGQEMSTLVNGRMMNITDQVFILFQKTVNGKEMSTLVNGRILHFTDQVFIPMPMGLHKKVFGKIMSSCMHQIIHHQKAMIQVEKKQYLLLRVEKRQYLLLQVVVLQLLLMVMS